jgi:hypothetical protein
MVNTVQNFPLRQTGSLAYKISNILSWKAYKVGLDEQSCTDKIPIHKVSIS